MRHHRGPPGGVHCPPQTAQYSQSQRSELASVYCEPWRLTNAVRRMLPSGPLCPWRCLAEGNGAIGRGSASHTHMRPSRAADVAAFLVSGRTIRHPTTPPRADAAVPNQRAVLNPRGILGYETAPSPQHCAPRRQLLAHRQVTHASRFLATVCRVAPQPPPVVAHRRDLATVVSDRATAVGDGPGAVDALPLGGPVLWPLAEGQPSSGLELAATGAWGVRPPGHGPLGWCPPPPPAPSSGTVPPGLCAPGAAELRLGAPRL